MSKILWTPNETQIKNANLTEFMNLVNERHGADFSSYGELYDWSVENISDFWAAMWDFGGMVHSKDYDSVVDDLKKMPGAKWFQGARLNFAENLLRYRDDRVAIVFKGEERVQKQLTYAELYDCVARLARSLRDMGVEKDDRVAGFMPNMPEAIIAMLAATSIGAIWSSCSPDFGIKGVLDRFGQIDPKVLFCADGYRYNGQLYDSLDKAAHLLEAGAGLLGREDRPG